MVLANAHTSQSLNIDTDSMTTKNSLLYKQLHVVESLYLTPTYHTIIKAIRNTGRAIFHPKVLYQAMITDALGKQGAKKLG